MAQNSTQRKLTAILSADVKGYSKLMGDDDESTVNTITAYRKIISELIQKYQGRVVDTPGDNILAEFGSALNAVNGAIDIQLTLDIENGKLPDHRRMEFRIGINLGDIIHKDDCIYGDGVNIAARIESLSAPGGICISRGVYDQVKRKIRQGFEYLGEHTVKNIPEPVRIYRILLEPENEGKIIGESISRTPKVRKSLITIGILLICSAVLLWVFFPQQELIEPASLEKMAFQLPDKPSIVVLPFKNISADSSNDFLSDGITENLITALSKVPKLFIIARDTSFTYKGKATKVQHVAEELGVKYILEGSVQKSGELVRIFVQLIDAISGHHRWSEKYDRDLRDLFALQDEITKEILTAVEVKLAEGEQARMMAKGTSSLNAYLKILQANYYRRMGNVEDNAKARRLANEAIALDPDYAMAYATLSRTHVMDVLLRSAKSQKDSLETAVELAKKALLLDNSLADAYDILGSTLVWQKKYAEGLLQLERALELEPNGADIHAHLGLALYSSDRLEEAVQAMKKAIRLNPTPPGWYLYMLAVIYNSMEKYDEAIAWGEKAITQNPKDLNGHVVLCATYSSAGHIEKARREAAEVLRINPKYSVSLAEKTSPQRNQAVKKRYFDALRKAGLPEYPPNEKAVKPSIAVLPFDNMSDDPTQEYFSDGIAEDIITDLSKISGLIVIARNSSFAYKGKSVNIQQIGQDLKVRYLLEGSVRKAGDKVRINAQLIDASSGHHLWADRYNGRMVNVFALQDKITRKIISALALKLTANEEKAVIDRGTDNLQAYDSFLKGWQGYRMMTKEGFAEAKIHLVKAVEIDPEFARAYAALAVLYWKAVQTASPELREGLGLTSRVARNAVRNKPHFLLKKAMNKPTALAHGLTSQFYLFRYQHDESLSQIEQAVAMDPNDPELYAWMSQILWLIGKNKEAIESAKMGLRLDPNNPTAYLFHQARAYLPDGDLEESLLLLERAKRLNPDFAGPIAITESIIYGIQGRDEEARIAYDIFAKSRQHPVRNLNDILLYIPFADPKKLDLIAEALIKAGAPGKPTDILRIFKENRIDGQAVKELLFDQKITGTAMSTGKQYWWEWDKNGNFQLDMQVVKDTGKSWFEQDIFFIQFDKLFGGLPYGTVIYRNPDGSIEFQNQYLMVSDTGSITPFAPIE